MITNAPLRVLLLEDQAIIAMDVEAMLTDAGMVVVANFSSCTQALVWLREHDADVAILDLHLQDGSCEAVAQRLDEREIPFVVFSGNSQTEETLHPIFASVSWLEKPASGDRIMAAVQDAAVSRHRSLARA